MKKDSKITVKILGDGAMGAIVAVADAKGNVKGYVQNKDLDYKKLQQEKYLLLLSLAMVSLWSLKIWDFANLIQGKLI